MEKQSHCSQLIYYIQSYKGTPYQAYLLMKLPVMGSPQSDNENLD